VATLELSGRLLCGAQQLGSSLTKRERIRPRTPVEELDFEQAIAGTRALSHELIEPLRIDAAYASRVDVAAVISAGLLAVDAHLESNGLTLASRAGRTRRFRTFWDAKLAPEELETMLLRRAKPSDYISQRVLVPPSVPLPAFGRRRSRV